jgi:hypothetical protein
MIIIKEAFFQDRLGVLEIKDDYIVLTFDKQFGSSRNKFNEDDYIEYQYMSSSELTHFKNKFKITRLPFEIYDEYKLQDIYDYLRGK